MRTSHLISLTAPARRVIAFVAVSALLLLGLLALASPAQASIAPGTNGKIVFGQIGPTGSTTCNTWSPDGSKVLCNVWTEDGVQPATANPDGSAFTLLNPDLPLDLFCLSWSPDGTRLFCHSEGMNGADAG